MREVELREAVDHRLRERFKSRPDTLIRHELGLCAGARRVDVAVINGHLDGWEIKSDDDSLRRLAGQATAYSLVLDRATLVTTERHLDGALRVLPDWWGIILATQTDAGTDLKQLRRPRVSPTLDAMSSAQLLWRDEALAVLRDHHLANGLGNRARWYVWERLAQSFSIKELRAIVRDVLRARRAWPGGQLLP